MKGLVRHLVHGDEGKGGHQLLLHSVGQLSRDLWYHGEDESRIARGLRIT